MPLALWVGLESLGGALFSVVYPSPGTQGLAGTEAHRTKQKHAGPLEAQAHHQSHLLLGARAGHIAELGVIHCGRNCKVTGQRGWIQRRGNNCSN